MANGQHGRDQRTPRLPAGVAARLAALRERLGQLRFEPRALARRTTRRLVLDPLYFRTGHVHMAGHDLHGFSHLVTSREGLFAVSERTWTKLMSGQFFGLTYRDGAFFAFEALGRYRPPDGGAARSRYERGRIVRLELDAAHRRIVRAGTAFRGLPNGVHQIDFIGDDLFAVDTYNNRILRLPATLDRVDGAFHPIGRAVQEDWEGGYAHMNSIVGHDGAIHVLLHNGRPDKARGRSQIIRCDGDMEVVTTTEVNGHACHNIVFLEDGSVLSCGSHDGELIDGTSVVAKVGDMYTRGLSVDATSVVVGSSLYTIRSGRHGRRYVPGQVQFFDRDYTRRATVPLPAAPTDIRRIDGRDLGLSNADRNG